MEKDKKKISFFDLVLGALVSGISGWLLNIVAYYNVAYLSFAIFVLLYAGVYGFAKYRWLDGILCAFIVIWLGYTCVYRPIKMEVKRQSPGIAEAMPERIMTMATWLHRTIGNPFVKSEGAIMESMENKIRAVEPEIARLGNTGQVIEAAQKVNELKKEKAEAEKLLYPSNKKEEEKKQESAVIQSQPQSSQNYSDKVLRQGDKLIFQNFAVGETRRENIVLAKGEEIEIETPYYYSREEFSYQDYSKKYPGEEWVPFPKGAEAKYFGKRSTNFRLRADEQIVKISIYVQRLG